MTQKRAKIGGEIGANGELYAGGRFLNTIPENPKREGSTPKKARKVQVGPFEWTVNVDGKTPIFIGAFGGCFGTTPQAERNLTTAMANTTALRYVGITATELANRVDRFVAGERWM